MGKKEKILKKIMENPERSDIKYIEVENLLLSIGFKKLEGKGSRVKFFDAENDNLISLHKPHPGNELKHYQVRYLQEKLEII